MRQNPNINKLKYLINFNQNNNVKKFKTNIIYIPEKINEVILNIYLFLLDDMHRLINEKHPFLTNLSFKNLTEEEKYNIIIKLFIHGIIEEKLIYFYYDILEFIKYNYYGLFQMLWYYKNRLSYPYRMMIEITYIWKKYNFRKNH